ncbi:hypothetical protein [Citrobacter meridianamericanus]|uniref:hypothetical protein n=1 Tax=Citrobacter meridianamericanus TaxID=2894201 RepID=UPI00351D923E
MKGIIFSLIFVLSGTLHAAGVSLELNRVALPEAINLIYSEVFSRPYMLAPELANDRGLCRCVSHQKLMNGHLLNVILAT